MSSSALVKSFERRIRELELKAEARTPKHVHLFFNDGRGGSYLTACTQSKTCKVWEATQVARHEKELAEKGGDESEPGS